MKTLTAIATMIFMLALIPAAQSYDIFNDDNRNSDRIATELVLAVDASSSIHADELYLQRKGYASALRSPDFLDRIRNSQWPHNRIAICYFEWSSAGVFGNEIDWMLLETPGDALTLAYRIENLPRMAEGSGTNMHSALEHARSLIETNGIESLSKVIDISADGRNYSNRDLDELRRELDAQDITVNGLAIDIESASGNNDAGSNLGPDDSNMAEYMDRCVRTGPDSFVETVRRRDEFDEVIERKLRRELAWKFSLIGTAHAAETDDPFCINTDADGYYP